jgi:hypothetical protein
MKRYIAALALLLTVPAVADDYVDIVEQAFADLSDDYHEEWAFTESVLEDGVTIVGRYDPRQSSNARWKLISVDGQQPTEEDIADYVDEKEDEFHDNDNKNDNNNDNAVDMVDLDTLELIEETNDAWVFSFVPDIIDNDDEDDEVAAKFMQHVAGTLRINRHTNSLEHIDLRNEKPIRPMLSVKISRFRTHLAFGPADGVGPIVPLSIDIEVKGRAMIVIGVHEVEATRYYDYEYAGS